MRMPCDHIGPAEVVEYAEQLLHERNLPVEKWEGTRVAWSGNVEPGRSVLVEVVRENDDWRVTRLERRQEPIDEAEIGFQVITAPC